MSLLDDVSIVVTPNGYKAGTLYGVIPVPTEGSELILSTLVNSTGFPYDTFDNATSSGFHAINTSGTDQRAGTVDELVIVANKRYKINIDINVASGSTPFFRLRESIGSGTTIKSGSLVEGNNTIYVTSSISQTSVIEFQSNSISEYTASNVSIKEYTASDMDVTRATAATRVDENGLVNYAQVVTGSDIVTNGDFSNGTTDWTLQNGWSLGSNDVEFNTSVSQYRKIFQENFLNIGSHYKLTFEIKSISSGSISNFGYSGSFDTIGVKSQIFTAIYDDLYLEPTGDAVLTIDNVKVEEVTRNNVPRIDYTGGGCPHILAEPQRTNLVTYSEDLSQWTLANGTLTPNATVSPDGTQNAGRVVFNNTGVDLKRTVTVVAGQTYTISFYIKLESGAGLQGRFYDNSNGANIEYYDYTSQIQGTQWSKVTRSVTAPSGCTEMQIWLIANSSSLVTASFWGAQFELGSYATSLIPTSGSTVTRNQDVFTRDGIGSLINSTEGTLFVEMAALSDDETYRTISLSDGTNDNTIRIEYEGSVSNRFRAVYAENGDYTGGITHTFDITQNAKIAYKYAENSLALWINGVEIGTYTATKAMMAPNTVNTLDFARADGANNFFGKVKQLQVYDTALTDNQLIQLTGEAGTHFFESYSEMAETLTYTIQ